MEWIRGSGEEVSLAILRYLEAYIPRTQMTLGGLTFKNRGRLGYHPEMHKGLFSAGINYRTSTG